MMLWENLKMAFISLGSSKMRSFLTMLGIIIGVAAVVSITAIGQGVKDQIKNQISGLGSNVLTVTSGASSKNGRGPNITSALGTSTLTTADADSLKKVRNITSVSTVSLISGVLAVGSTQASDAFMLATTPEYSDITDLKLSSGRFINDADIASAARVMVIGDAVKVELFGTNEAIGKTVLYRGKEFTVIGVKAKTDSGASLGGPSQDAFTFMPRSTAKVLTGQDPSILRIIAQVNSPDNVDRAADSSRIVIKKNHGGQEDFSVQTQDDLLATFDTILNLLTTFIAAIASISLLVGGIGIMNIMLVNVTERTREIGLRKAIGATSGVVLSQFLIEAMVLSLLGGALGIVAAYVLATIGGKFAGITPGFTPGSILLAVSVSAAVGIIFGIAPAYKASRLRPIQALKSL